MAAIDNLSDQHRAFVEHYLASGFNATRAARLAGYSPVSAHSTGYDILKNPEVKQAVSERLEQFAMPANEVLARLGAQGRADPGDWIDDRGAISIDLMKETGSTHLIREVSWEEEGRLLGRGEDAELVTVRKRKVRLHDAQKALELLARHHGLLNDKVDVTSQGDKVGAVVMIPSNERDTG